MIMHRQYLLIISSILFSVAASGQAGPPPMAMPKDSNIILIDKIIEVTQHENYFVNYCTKKVKSFAQENNWTNEKTNEILESIQFKYYNSTVYNSYSFYTTEQLGKLFDALTVLYKDSKSHTTMILTNSMMQSNLDLFVESVLEGKYVIKR